MAFTVAIVGRPNVGKSTLFNRLVGRRAALVARTPGVTRDRREGWARIGPLRFRAIDTAGLEEAAPETLAGRMMAQTARALEEADAALAPDRRPGRGDAGRRVLREPAPAVAGSHYSCGQQVRGQRCRGRDRGEPRPRAWAADPDLGGARGGPCRPLRRVEPLRLRGGAGCRRTRRGRRAPARHRGPPQCRQVDAAQSAGGRGACHHRCRAGAHAGFDRGALVLRGPGGRVGGYRGHAPPGQDREGARQALIAGRRARPWPGGGGARRVRRHRSR